MWVRTGIFQVIRDGDATIWGGLEGQQIEDGCLVHTRRARQVS